MKNIIEIEGTEDDIADLIDFPEVIVSRNTAEDLGSGTWTVDAYATDDALTALTTAGYTYTVIVSSTDYSTHLDDIYVDPNASV